MNPTVLDLLIESIKKASAFNNTTQVAPAAVLWTDKDGQWESVVTLLQGSFPQLLKMGEYSPNTKTGPAIWLKCMIARTLPEADWAESAVPIIYLPGVSRMELRAIESCRTELQPLAELQYRGTFWSQKNGKDWTLFAFLKSNEGGIGLDLAQDEKTLEAVHRAFSHVLEVNVDTLRGKRLEANDFNLLLTADPVREVLRWLDDSVGTKKQWTAEMWEAYVSLCKTEFGFNPITDGELVGAEKLAGRQGPWSQAWTRFTESPRLYPKLPELIRRTSPPTDLLADKSGWPQSNDARENDLRACFLDFDKIPPHVARAKILELEKEHGERRKWVWATLGHAPLANALEYLVTVASGTQKQMLGSTHDEIAAAYLQNGWQVDDAVIKALANVSRAEDVAALQTVLHCIYLPWLEEGAFNLQELAVRGKHPRTIVPAEHQEGDLVLFVDGLRLDVGQQLMHALESTGNEASLACVWSAHPTVTSTAKPAVSPVAEQISGSSQCSDFVPMTLEGGKALTIHHFRKLLEREGWQILAKGDYGSPEGKAWAEFGDFDHYGHEHGWKLARHIGEQLFELLEYLEGAFDAGWQRVRVVTDHGWLLLPGGLPKVELHKCLVESRWGRCAQVKDSAVLDIPVVPWHWSADIQVASAPGVCSFTSGKVYDHGGISLQECLIPVVTISRPAAKLSASITDHTWRGLRCKVTIEGEANGLVLDLRTKPADKDSSVAKGGKSIEDGSSSSLVVENDELLGTAAVLVVVDQTGMVLSKVPTTIGGDK